MEDRVGFFVNQKAAKKTPLKLARPDSDDVAASCHHRDARGNGVATPARSGAEVFCFFFSKKKSSLSSRLVDGR
jgi:hypothetical protein